MKCTQEERRVRHNTVYWGLSIAVSVVINESGLNARGFVNRPETSGAFLTGDSAGGCVPALNVVGGLKLHGRRG